MKETGHTSIAAGGKLWVSTRLLCPIRLCGLSLQDSRPKYFPLLSWRFKVKIQILGIKRVALKGVLLGTKKALAFMEDPF